MKISFSSKAISHRGFAREQLAFTLAEILVAMAIFMFVIAGVLSANLFGLRMFQTHQTKLNVSQWSRITFNKITDEIHSCTNLMVGNMDTTNGNFAGLLDGETQSGNGLLIYPNANTNNFILYYVDPSAQTFMRTTDQTNPVVLAYTVTNALAFSAEDFTGTVLTNNQNNRVIHLLLQMYQPSSYMQDGDFYQLDTSVTRRVLQ